MGHAQAEDLGLAALLIEGAALAAVGMEWGEADAVRVVEDWLEALLREGGLGEPGIVAHASRLRLLLGEVGGLDGYLEDLGGQ